MNDNKNIVNNHPYLTSIWRCGSSVRAHALTPAFAARAFPAGQVTGEPPMGLGELCSHLRLSAVVLLSWVNLCESPSPCVPAPTHKTWWSQKEKCLKVLRGAQVPDMALCVENRDVGFNVVLHDYRVLRNVCLYTYTHSMWIRFSLWDMCVLLWKMWL